MRNITVREGVLDRKTYLRDPYLMQIPHNKIIDPSPVLLKRDSFKRTGLFDLPLKQILDLVHWYKVMLEFKIGFVDEQLVTFRLHAGQATQVNSASGDIPDPGMQKRLFHELFGPHLDPAVRKALWREVSFWARLRTKALQRLRGLTHGQ